MKHQAAYDHCEALVREADRDRFLSTLFAPKELRPHLLALYAWNVEIAAIRERTHAALAGEMRLQWWRDALMDRGYGDVGGNPVAAALLDTAARFYLPTQSLLELIESRRFDLYDEPMASLGDLEKYGSATAGAVIALAAEILAGASPECRAAAAHAGIAYAIAALMAALPVHGARRQLYLPLDILKRHDVDPESVFAEEDTPGLRTALADLRQTARGHLDSLRAALPEVPPLAGPAFLIIATVKPTLKRMGRLRYDPFAPPALPQWRRQWAMWRASWGGILDL